MARLETEFLDCQREEGARGDRQIAGGRGSQSKGFFRRALCRNPERAPLLGTQLGSWSPD